MLHFGRGSVFEMDFFIAFIMGFMVCYAFIIASNAGLC